MLDEFALIEQFFARATASGEDIQLGIGDDAALVTVPATQQLAVCTDTLVSGRHFPLATTAADIGWKALAVNVSDLAAMGAEPRWFTLALTLPAADADWLRGFSCGLAAMAAVNRLSLIGGDTTRGPLSITVTAGGWVAPGASLTRRGAQPGDVVCVTGTLGDAALALRRLNVVDADHARDAWLRDRLNRPTPRVAAGRALAGLAHAGIDISDGLLADLGHLLAGAGGDSATDSGGDTPAGAVIDVRRLPRSAAFSARAAANVAVDLQLAGGDDYELCVCLAPQNVPEATQRLAALGVPLTRIGKIIAEPGLWIEDEGGQRACSLGGARGFNHFSERGEGL